MFYKKIPFQAFVKNALDVLNAQDADPKRISLAIRALGKLAACIVKFSGKESLKDAFHRLEPFGSLSRFILFSVSHYVFPFRQCELISNSEGHLNFLV